MNPLLTRSRAALLVLLVLGLAACGADPGPKPARTPAAAPAPGAEPTTATTPAPAEEPLPAQRLEAGTVAEGVPAAVSGEGDAVVALTRDGDFGVVAHLDCSACTGHVVLSAEGRGSAWGEGPAPLTGSYLVDVVAGSAPQQELVVRTQGPWTLQLQSWNDLPVATGVQQGTGATVLLLGDDASAIRLDYAPADADDAMLARVVSGVELTGSGGPQTLALGDDVPFSERVDVRMPGVVVLGTRGSWTVTPLP
ncbi:hypothetical protein [Cellulomonas sp. Marseille-Q8402]